MSKSLGNLQPKQLQLACSRKKYILFGGARAGGKSWATEPAAASGGIRQAEEGQSLPPPVAESGRRRSQAKRVSQPSTCEGSLTTTELAWAYFTRSEHIK